MPAIYQGDKKIVDRYVGETLVTRAYQGDKLIFDAYSELSGTLPLAVRSRVSQILQNYIIYGESVQDDTPTPDNPVEVTGLGVRTANLLEYLDDMRNANKWTTTENAFFMYYELSESQLSRLKVIGVVYGKVFLKSRGTYYDGEVLAITPDRYNYVDNRYRLLQNTGVALDYSYDFTNMNKAYLCIGYGPRITSKNKQTLINAMFDNYDIMLSSATPDHYIPYGYKLPIKVTSNGTTTDYPVYIGDSQLMEGEYVDYAEQKVYKRSKNLVSPAIAETKVVNGITAISDGNGSYHLYGTASSDATILFSVDPFYIPSVEDGFVIALFNNPGVGNNCSVTIGWAISLYQANRVLQSPAMQAGRYVEVLSFSIRSGTVCDFTISPVVVPGSEIPQRFIPYLQPTDPPVPLPDITIPKGEVTIDIEGELKPQATVKGRINPTA